MSHHSENIKSYKSQSNSMSKHHAMHTYVGMQMRLRAQTLASDATEWSISCSGHLTLGKEGPRYPLDRRPGGPQM
jgi:hypothetical protein